MFKKLYLLLAAACVITFIINSCKKDFNKEQQNNVSDPAIAQAKNWYESTYPVNASKLNTQAVNSSNPDWSQRIKPDWQHTASYSRFNKQVIEMPADPSIKFETALLMGPTKSNKSYSRNYFLLLNDGKKYEAYVMIVIADSNYVNHDLSKLAHNTYRKHDTDFSGSVLYFTPKGQYVNGYSYKNGQLITLISTGQQPENKHVQSIQNSSQKVNDGIECYEWYLVHYEDGVAVSSEYLGTTCSSMGGGGGSGGGPGNTPPDNGFPPPAVTSPDFGLDDPKVCLNCRIDDADFDDLLDYVQSIGLRVNDPYNDVVTVNGVQYKGQITQIFNAAGELVSNFFSPDVNSGPFQVGIEYNVGNTGPDGNSTNSGNTLDQGVILYFGNTRHITGGSVTYTGSGGGNTVLTPDQVQAMEALDNTRLINLMNQEDARDDAAMSPCHGTFRNGNVMWPGTAEHWLIQFDYMATNPLALREYFIPGSSGKLTGAAGYADIADPSTNQMFEIKPNNNTGIQVGAAEVQLYVAQGNLLCPPSNGGSWTAGGNYPTRYLPDPKNPSNVLKASLISPGVIVYESEPRNGQPEPVPVPLPQNLADKLKNLFQSIKANPSTRQQQVITFVRQNPKIVPYLKSASAGIIIGTILEDIASDGVGILDDWESFLIARTLWRVANGIVII